MKRTFVALITSVAALIAWTNTPAQSLEITILVNQGALSGVRDLAAGYEKATGHKVVIDFAGVAQQEEKIKTDAPGDLVVNFMPAFDEIIKEGKVIGPVVEFARAGNGVAVKAGAPRPDINTAEGFKRAKKIFHAETIDLDESLSPQIDPTIYRKGFRSVLRPAQKPNRMAGL